jgi:hypothetical protein
MIDTPATTNKFYTLYIQYNRLDGIKRAEKFQELCIYAYKSGGLRLLDSILNKELKDGTDSMTKNIIRASIIYRDIT